ncbi:C-x8-C-x5-C-x3-H type zinc finger protein [Paecilomyces variotii No. 5]|uniref:C-x8-C-x5-C-x3-H type zinc finger protein n=1 Tax=Byssochlamys spectabilis (strain No. 5 / NBRC 109023) TaxID=1356009 RepID=V5HQX7_BYSSN|nr:C-x8-C-x5-C-x3-H type zinc finger protein [Paecilomyces variotii No. 5]
MMSTANTQLLFERYEQDLLQRVSELEEAYQQEKLDHQRETRFNRDIQIHEMELMDQITRIKTIMDREAFVIAFLDGDGMIFQDYLLQQGEQGGRDAANQLWACIRDYVTRNLPSISSPKIITKIFANVQGLAETCVKAGIIDKTSLFEDFVRGFNGSRLLFDFVDVGTGKDRADDKLAEETLADRELTGRISLIEGAPFERELESIKSSYRVTKFPDLFRNSKIVTSLANLKSATLSAPLAVRSPNQPVATLTRTSTNTTSSSATATTSWASISATPGDVKISTPKPSTPAPKVERNKYGQRIDRLEFKTIPKEELNRVKKMKLCNVHFLLGECPNDEKCYHDHDHKLTKSERVVLQSIARMTPCHYGPECDDPKCIYGHRCPLSEAGKKECFWGSNCRFDTSAHGIDTQVVRVTKV